MSGYKAFNKMKSKILKQNEETFGTELRQKYGNDIVDNSNKKFEAMNENEYDRMEALLQDINNSLKEGFMAKDPAGSSAQKACELHKDLLVMTWPENTYSKQSQLALVEGFLQDERFIAYYDKIAEGCTKFFVEAMRVYCK